MMNIRSFLLNIVNELRQDSFFENVRIVRAYPYVTKPTEPSQPAVAINIGGISCRPCHIGDDSLATKLDIYADIYVPFKLGGDYVSDIFCRLCECVRGLGVQSIITKRTTADIKSGCYVMECSIGFERELELGGEQGE